MIYHESADSRLLSGYSGRCLVSQGVNSKTMKLSTFRSACDCRRGRSRRVFSPGRDPGVCQESIRGTRCRE
eukprot:2763441-Pyramimonas_sp.AAC.1